MERPARDEGGNYAGMDDIFPVSSWSAGMDELRLNLKAEGGASAFRRIARGVDVVLDSCGGRQMATLGDITAPRGKLILYGLNGGNEAAFPAWTAFRKHLKFFQYSLLDFTGHAELGIPANRPAVEQALQAINQLTEAGLLRPTIDRVFDFDQAVEAHRYMETQPANGRIVIAVPDAIARAKDAAA